MKSDNTRVSAEQYDKYVKFIAAQFSEWPEETETRSRPNAVRLDFDGEICFECDFPKPGRDLEEGELDFFVSDSRDAVFLPCYSWEKCVIGHAISETEWKTARFELVDNAPAWSTAPEWATHRYKTVLHGEWVFGQNAQLKQHVGGKVSVTIQGAKKTNVFGMADDPNWADTLTPRPESHEPEKPKSYRGDLLRSVIEHFQNNGQASPSDFRTDEHGRISDFDDLYDAIADQNTLRYDQVRYRDLTPGTTFKFMGARGYDDKMVTCVLLKSKSANGFHQHLPLVSSASRVSVLSDHMAVTIVDE